MSVGNRILLSLTSRYFESVSARNKWVTRLPGTTRRALSRRSSYIAERLLQKTTDSTGPRGWTLSFSASTPHRQAPGIGTGRQAGRQAGSNSRLQRPNAGMQQANAMIMKVLFLKASHSCRIKCERSESAQKRRIALYKSSHHHFSLGLNNIALFRAFCIRGGRYNQDLTADNNSNNK